MAKKGGWMSTKYEPRSGRPIEGTTQEMVENSYKIVLADSRHCWFINWTCTQYFASTLQYEQAVWGVGVRFAHSWQKDSFALSKRYSSESLHWFNPLMRLGVTITLLRPKKSLNIGPQKLNKIQRRQSYGDWFLGLQQDNASDHNSLAPMVKIHKLKFKLLPHPPHTPDLAPIN